MYFSYRGHCFETLTRGCYILEKVWVVPGERLCWLEREIPRDFTLESQETV